MRGRLLRLWDHLRSSFWFLPLVVAAASIALAFGTVALDRRETDQWLKATGWTYTGGAEGASAMLGTIAGSMITIAGVVFSLTLVALSLATSQFGPRLLRNFMRDTINQLVLGTFVATFLYCLLVLRTIRRAEEIAFVPHLSVTLGVVFAILSLGVLIYYIHHVSVSIQADAIISRVGAELNAGVETLFPEEIGRGADADTRPVRNESLPDDFERAARPVLAGRDGYVQFTDGIALLSAAVEEDLIIRTEHRPGQFVVRGTPVAWVWPGERLSDALSDHIREAFVIGSYRIAAQDIEFTGHQLVEIASRALSPGVNDPFTAIACIDRLGAALARVAQRELPSPFRYSEDDRLRLVTPRITFAGITDAVFHQIRQDARGSVSVTIRLLETIAVVARVARRVPDGAVLRRHADMIVRGAREAIHEPEDLHEVEERHSAVLAALHVLETSAVSR